MNKTLFRRFAGSVSRFKHSVHEDEFFQARLRITLLFFCVGAIIFLVVGAFMDIFIDNALYALADPQTTDVHAAVYTVRELLWIGRAIRLFLIVTSAYFLAGFSLKPIKQLYEKQKRFIDNVSHEFRTPLAVMKSASDVALRNRAALTQTEAVAVIESNLEEVDRLTKIIRFFLLSSHAGDERMQPTKQHVTLHNITLRVIDTLEMPAQKAGVLVTLGQGTCEGAVLGDPITLEQMLINLIRNAIEHTLSGGSVTVTVTQASKGKVRLTVADTGEGVTEEDLPKVFEPFYRGRQTSAASDNQNAGLGLSIVKEIVRLHDARIHVERCMPKGTAFIVDFPALR